MRLDTNLIIGNGLPNILTSNTRNVHVETAQFMQQAKILESNIEDIQERATKIGKPLPGKQIDIFA
tara:strand:+ start:213 stop:410 length:198 start_codon:yes stop_codon:yes gene_type:complete